MKTSARHVAPRLTDSKAQALSWGKSSRNEYLMNHPGKEASEVIHVYEVKPLPPVISWAENARAETSATMIACNIVFTWVSPSSAHGADGGAEDDADTRAERAKPSPAAPPAGRPKIQSDAHFPPASAIAW